MKTWPILPKIFRVNVRNTLFHTLFLVSRVKRHIIPKLYFRVYANLGNIHREYIYTYINTFYPTYIAQNQAPGQGIVMLRRFTKTSLLALSRTA